MNDLTVIYLTANEISDWFAENTRGHLIDAIGKSSLIVVSKKPIGAEVFQRKELDLSARYLNIVTEEGRSHVGIYRDALRAASLASTQYIAIAEDDVLYSREHFKKRPTRPDVFAYNVACWSIYAWSNPPIFSYTGRRNHGMLICERELYVKAFTERFEKFPDESHINNAIWAEPGKYESQLGVKVQQTEVFYTDPANIMFTHPQGLSFNTLGMKKRLAPIRAYEIPYWGRAEEVLKLYE